MSPRVRDFSKTNSSYHKGSFKKDSFASSRTAKDKDQLNRQESTGKINSRTPNIGSTSTQVAGRDSQKNNQRAFAATDKSESVTAGKRSSVVG